ncbi:MAG: nicotinate (nicotinamide) nucleotide adenylyltransferase [Desulfovibrio sp.]|nr:nicotinate (nicotinamide) nucleotide adenylyltransferase [Desulfovibrio sp.]
MAARPEVLIVLGGSFNPPHIGHLRLAIEARESFAPKSAKVLLVPCARPPHKASESFLPFALRCRLLEACTANLPDLSVSRLEGERTALSYTWDTLVALKQQSQAELFFLLGSDDFLALSTWFKGLALPTLAHFLVVPRGPFSEEDCLRAIFAFWPKAQSLPGRAPHWLLPEGGKISYLPLPWLEVSATDIRRRFLEQKALDYLVPDSVLEILQEQAEQVRTIWGRERSQSEIVRP